MAHYFGNSSINKHLQTHLTIEVPLVDIVKSQQQYCFIRCAAKLVNGSEEDNRMRTGCYVAADWNKSKVPPVSDPINIMDHLDKLLPRFGDGIGLITFQNGIQNELEDLKKIGDSILAKLPEKPLCIGLHNPTKGKNLNIHGDLLRMINEWEENAATMLFTRQLFFTLAHFIPKINPRMRWVHIAHSEGGLICHQILTNYKYPLDLQNSRFFKSQLTTLTFGAVAPIPDNVVAHAINTYSKDDVMIRLHGKTLLDLVPEPTDTTPEDDELMPAIHRNKGAAYQAQIEAYKKKRYIFQYPYKCTKNGCTITVVKSAVAVPPIVSGDHSIQDVTYQTELKK